MATRRQQNLTTAILTLATVLVAASAGAQADPQL
jgi:hypothetical protein